MGIAKTKAQKCKGGVHECPICSFTWIHEDDDVPTCIFTKQELCPDCTLELRWDCLEDLYAQYGPDISIRDVANMLYTKGLDMKFNILPTATKTNLLKVLRKGV